MHETSLKSGESFLESYGKKGELVVDIGGKDVNGSLRQIAIKLGMGYVCVDIEPDISVNIIVKPTQRLPFEDNSIDLVVSTSCFEHDPCFWLTFKEMTRIVKREGYIYINAPTRGIYHGYPGDNWRFYSDAGQALAYWSGIQIGNEKIHSVKVIETFNVLGDDFNDFVCVWKKTNEISEEITVEKSIINNVGVLEQSINTKGFMTRKKC